ncbi:uroporphyrinogen-III synthase [Notoacmeibacter marinus]|uniref:uroporphyrinogen-III synthase n=1 Tax=Notoacmeibacter marinus TaxID=1876515 RepID=UPI000DF3FC69|nr:uroporphyrinogen-III synthase [Notoacmeibacter marinus]
MARRLSVLVTRPQPGAELTARAVERRGHIAHLLPLTEIIGLKVDLPSEHDFDGIVATSANAIRHLSTRNAARLAHLPVWAVGPATAQAARDLGFTQVEALGGDAETLAAKLIEREPSSLLYLAGKVRRSGLEDRLTEAGIPVTTREVYDTVPIACPPASLDILRATPIDVVVLTSTLTAQLFRALEQKEALAKGAIRLCFSTRIAEISSGACRIAKTASQEAAITLLDEIADE